MSLLAPLHVRPLHMWIVDVEREAGVSVDLTPEWKRRFRLWQDSGETVSEAARMLRVLVGNQRRLDQSWQAQASRAIRNARRA